MSLSSDGAVMTMPVQPAYQGGNGGFGGWGGDWASWIILFLIFGMFGWGGYGGGWGGNSGNGLGSPSGQGWATRADINEGFALNGLQTGQSGILSAVTNGFHGVDNAICNLGYQLQDCCCQTQRAVDGVNYTCPPRVRLPRRQFRAFAMTWLPRLAIPGIPSRTAPGTSSTTRTPTAVRSLTF